MSEKMSDVSNENKRLIAEARQAYENREEAELGVREAQEYSNGEEEDASMMGELLDEEVEHEAEARAAVENFYATHKDELHEEALLEDKERTSKS